MSQFLQRPGSELLLRRQIGEEGQVVLKRLIYIYIGIYMTLLDTARRIM